MQNGFEKQMILKDKLYKPKMPGLPVPESGNDETRLDIGQLEKNKPEVYK